MNISRETTKINAGDGNRVSRRSIFAAIPALAFTATAATAFAKPDAPIKDMPELPEWWERLVGNLQAGEVPHRTADYRVVKAADLDAIYSARDGGMHEATPNTELMAQLEGMRKDMGPHYGVNGHHEIYAVREERMTAIFAAMDAMQGGAI